LNGIDVYSGTNITNWNAVKAAGVKHIYIKATEGLTYENPKLDAQFRGAKSVGILAGFYHFARANDPVAEYNHFINTIKKYNTDLRNVLDYEESNVSLAFIKKFMAQDPTLIFYAPHSIADLVATVPNKDVWIAEPNTNPTNTKGYAGIQHNFHGSVNGLAGPADLDLFSTNILKNNVVVGAAPAPVTIKNIIKSVVVKVMQQGENSQRVRLLQSILSILVGGVTVDGDFGPNTFKAVVKYQGIMKLKADGIAGPNTINTLLNDLKVNWFHL
jgi:lysozyme